MKLDDVALLDRCRVQPGESAGLVTRDPGWVPRGGKGESLEESKAAGKKVLKRGVKQLRAWQEKLWAADRWSLLLVFQAMDAAGKDSTIKHVFSGVNPQGCRVVSFKQPSSTELDHDFLWRCSQELPSRGRIGIFNRSYYEEVLVVRVHPALLGYQKLPAELLPVHAEAGADGGGPGEAFWRTRFESINDFERHLAHNGTRVVKFFLHVSPEEQKRRFLDRLREPEKHWKFSHGDLKDRDRWEDYMKAYEAAISATSSAEAPWYVVPADHKWVTRAVVVQAIVREIAALNPAFPEVSDSARAELAEAQRRLEAES